MVDPVTTAAGGVLFATSVQLGRQAITAGMLYRSVSTPEDDPSTPADGETGAVEGTENVRDPPELADRLPADGEASIGAYVWRLRTSESFAHNLDAETPGADMNVITYASGLESGTFTVDDDRRTVRVDTDWIAGKYETSDITIMSPDRQSWGQQKRCWASPHVNLDEHWIFASVADMDDVFDGDAAGECSDDEYFESRAILDGETLAVRGAVTIERGTPCSGEATRRRWRFPIGGSTRSATVSDAVL